jgi:hypothetical protein
MACEESTKQSAAAGTPAPAPAGQPPLAEGLAPGQGGPPESVGAGLARLRSVGITGSL